MSNYTILIIDYEPKSIERVRRPLTEVGYTVEVATDGLSGIDLFHRIKPDLVMIEAMIPKKHGFEVCQEIKKTPHGKRTPVIITTSVYKGRKYRSQAFHLHGCDEYIEKPIDEQQIVEVCKRMLGDTGSRMAGQDAPALPDVFDLTSMQTEEPSVATAFSLPASEVDEDELEIMARLDSILPGGSGAKRADDLVAQPMASRGAADPPLTPSVTDDAAESPYSQFDPLPLEEGTKSLPIAGERSTDHSIDLGETTAPMHSRDWNAEEPELDPVVAFESGRSRKRGRKQSVASSVGRGQASLALATPTLDVVEERLPRTQVVARLEPDTERIPLETLRPALGKTEQAIMYEPEVQIRPWWVSIAVALTLIGAAGALVYLYLGGMFGGGTN